MRSAYSRHLCQRVARACGAAAPRTPGPFRTGRHSIASPPAAGPRSVSSALARIAARYTRVAVGRLFRIPRAEMRLHRLESSARRSRMPRSSVRLIAIRQRRCPSSSVGTWYFQRPSGSIGVRHVARRLLEIGHQPAPLEHLGEHVRHAFAREMHAAELGDRVVAVIGEDLRVQLLGPLEAHFALADAAACSHVLVELVEEQPPQRLRRSRVPREERALHGFRQVGQREDGSVEIGEIRRERALFV